jgi:rod shape-determining protein MreD
LRIIGIILITAVVFILQVTVVDDISSGLIAPDLIVVLLVVLVLEKNPVAAVAIGFCLGFLQDLGNASLLGMNALIKSILAYSISRYGGSFLPERTVYKAILILLAFLAGDFIQLCIVTSFNIADVVNSFFRYSFLSGIYTAVLGVAILKVIELVTGRMVGSGAGYGHQR